MARPAPPHRRPRPLRVATAGALLVLSAAACLVTLLAAPQAAVVVLPLSCLLGVVAGLLLHSRLGAERAQHATDRRAQARSFTEAFVTRSAEHAAYAARTGSLLAALRREVRELEGTLRLAEARGDEAEHRLREERGRALRAEIRVIELEEALDRRQWDQIDELAAWPADDVDTVVDLLSWDQRLDAGDRPSRSA